MPKSLSRTLAHGQGAPLSPAKGGGSPLGREEAEAVQPIRAFPLPLVPVEAALRPLRPRVEVEGQAALLQEGKDGPGPHQEGDPVQGAGSRAQVGPWRARSSPQGYQPPLGRGTSLARAPSSRTGATRRASPRRKASSV